MHNKSLTADGATSILGGRNIGDIYFGFGEGVQFIDTDVMVAGQAAADIWTDCDRYWQRRSSHPIARIVEDQEEISLYRLISDAGQAQKSTEGRRYAERLRNSNFVSRIEACRLTFEWTKVALVSDDPSKGVGKAEIKDLLFPQLMALLSKPSRSVDIVSAYFVPGKEFSDALEQLARAGIRVRILTNSQAATDVVAVHTRSEEQTPDLQSL